MPLSPPASHLFRLLGCALRPRRGLPALGVVLVTAIFLALVQNLSLARAVGHTLPLPFGAQEWRIVASVLVTLVNLLLLALLPFSLPRVARPAAAVALLLAAVCSYFMDSFGAVLDRSMMVNVFGTDAHETADLLRGAFWTHVLSTGVLPAVLVLCLRVRPEALLPALRRRALAFVAILALQLAVVLPQYNTLAFWGREHREVRTRVNPTYPIYSAYRYVRERVLHTSGRPLEVVAPDAVRARAAAATPERPFLVVLVVGETARAQNFRLNGYARDTNPRLARQAGLIGFADVRACGTATAESVPCMFSDLTRRDFSRSRASARQNVLDVLARTGVSVQWWDNDSGCQGVCRRVAWRNLETDPDPAYCAGGRCLDGVLLRDLPGALPKAGQASLLVLHTQGSHGPAYFKRYPDSARRFTPDCRDENVQRCSRAEVINAYDNSLVYTDALLSQAIDTLRGAAGTVDSVLLYVSDHGESLGENGVYLHGLPYALAPDQQTRVPMIAWFSDGARRRLALDAACSLRAAARPVSHDHLFHSLLGLFAVRTRAYDPALDLFGACRDATRGAPSAQALAARGR